MKSENELIFVGYTNGDQLLYTAESEGMMFNNTENGCHIPLYMLKQHAHRIETTSEMNVTLEQIQKQWRKQQ
jgi:hypothetical protein